jgi:hypothetical protein
VDGCIRETDEEILDRGKGVPRTVGAEETRIGS